jgi:hypothetical protein
MIRLRRHAPDAAPALSVICTEVENIFEGINRRMFIHLEIVALQGIFEIKTFFA